MLIDFKLKNYKSYLNEIDFSMVANADKSHMENLENFGRKNLSKVGIMYGANASGKTTFIQAIDFVRMFSIISNRLVEGNPIPNTPYLFRDDYANKESEFSIVFEKKGIKYSYSFSCTRERVINEKLDIYKSAKPTNIFTRTNTNDYTFNSDARVLNEIKSKNTKNKLFLVTAATWNYEKVKPVVDFIMNDIVVLYDVNQPMIYDINYIVSHNDFEDYKKFCLEFLNNADLSISGFEINTKKVKELSIPLEFMSNIINVVVNNDSEKMNNWLNSDAVNIKTHHKISNGENEKDYTLELIEESMGTKQLFYLAPVLYYVFKEGKTLFVDEIDRSLHPMLVEYIIKKFLNKDINKNKAQLICNTHDTNLLNLEIFRRDEIWFTERDNKTGISDLYALSDFSPRKDENVEKSYLLGRFGAVPFIKED